MNNLLNLSGISFGKDDATIEASQGFLGKVFLKTSFYNRVRSGQKFLVTGRKGSGKSAICFFLIDALNADGRNTIMATSRLLSVPKMQQINNTSINDKEKFESIWRYVFLVKIAIKFIEIANREGIDTFHFNSQEQQHLKEVKSFLAQNNEISKNTWQNTISFLNIFSKFSTKLPGGVEAGIETRQIETVKDLSNMLDRFENSILCLLNKSKIFRSTILVDEIDDIWDSTEDSKPLIIGLLDATKKLNASLKSNVLILIFLRSDIWDGLTFSDKDKFRSEEERISWTEDDLKHLIANRGKIAANIRNNSSSIDQIWSMFFEDRVCNQDSFKYIVDRTLKRPREVIQFCNQALSIAQDSKHSRITEKDILTAEARYSIWKLDDLINEFSVQYPFLRDALSMFDGFQSSFSKNKMEAIFEDGQILLSKRFPELSNLDLNSFLQILFSIGFIGAKIAGKNIYLHDESDRPRIVITNLINLEAIVVHPAFHLALGLRDYFTESINIIQNNSGSVNYNIQIGGTIGGNIVTGDNNIVRIKQIESDESKPDDNK
jgi:Cdc6-like AAA superfamily ATPase